MVTVLAVCWYQTASAKQMANAAINFFISDYLEWKTRIILEETEPNDGKVTSRDFAHNTT